MNKSFALACLCVLFALPFCTASLRAAANGPAEVFADKVPPPAAAIAALRARAEAGDAGAQYDFGRLYERGRGVRKDYARAKQWFLKAAALGNAEAQVRLGIFYDLGEGVAPNDVEAVKWFKMAAEQGNITAELRLGDLYANQFRASSFTAHDRTTPLNHPEPVADYREEAFKWYHRAANAGNPEAQASLGTLYAEALGYREEAYFWLSLAAANDTHYKNARDKAASRLTSEKIADTQKRLQDWKPAPTPTPVPSPAPAAAGLAVPPPAQTAALLVQIPAASPAAAQAPALLPSSSPIISPPARGAASAPENSWPPAPMRYLSGSPPIISLPPSAH